MNKLLKLLIFALIFATTTYLLFQVVPYFVWEWFIKILLFYYYFTTLRSLFRVGKTTFFAIRRFQEMSVIGKVAVALVALGCLGLVFKFWAPIRLIWKWRAELKTII